jgi:hypothetical protein
LVSIDYVGLLMLCNQRRCSMKSSSQGTESQE